jgi:phage baseplate assembly protein W
MHKDDVPKISFPFRMVSSGKNAVYVEQDSDEEVMDCVEVLLRTEVGSREEIPEFGLPDQAFRLGGVDIQVVLASVNRWEPRARRSGISADQIEELVQTSRIEITQRGK